MRCKQKWRSPITYEFVSAPLFFWLREPSDSERKETFSKGNENTMDERISYISSRQNPLIVACGKYRDKKYRDRDKVFLFEGRKLFNEALISGLQLSRIFVTEDALKRYMPLFLDAEKQQKHFPISVCTDAVYAKISCENSPEGILCLAKYIDKSIKSTTIYMGSTPECVKGERFLICDGLRDPGNLGAILRTAAAFGWRRIVLSDDCADVYHWKTVRASMGGLFRLSVDLAGNLVSYIDSLKVRGYRVYAADAAPGATRIQELGERSAGIGIVVGNEGHGIREAVAKRCCGAVSIPMPGGMESLNAAVAASLFMWELTREDAHGSA